MRVLTPITLYTTLCAALALAQTPPRLLIFDMESAGRSPFTRPDKKGDQVIYCVAPLLLLGSQRGPWI